MLSTTFLSGASDEYNVLWKKLLPEQYSAYRHADVCKSFSSDSYLQCCLEILLIQRVINSTDFVFQLLICLQECVEPWLWCFVRRCDKISRKSFTDSIQPEFSKVSIPSDFFFIYPNESFSETKRWTTIWRIDHLFELGLRLNVISSTLVKSWKSFSLSFSNATNSFSSLGFNQNFVCA